MEGLSSVVWSSSASRVSFGAFRWTRIISSEIELLLHDAAERDSRSALAWLPLRRSRATVRLDNDHSGRYRGRHRHPSRFLPSVLRPLPAAVRSSGARSRHLARTSATAFPRFPAQLRIRVYGVGRSRRCRGATRSRNETMAGEIGRRAAVESRHPAHRQMQNPERSGARRSG